MSLRIYEYMVPTDGAAAVSKSGISLKKASYEGVASYSTPPPPDATMPSTTAATEQNLEGDSVIGFAEISSRNAKRILRKFCGTWYVLSLHR